MPLQWTSKRPSNELHHSWNELKDSVGDDTELASMSVPKNDSREEEAQVVGSDERASNASSDMQHATTTDPMIPGGDAQPLEYKTYKRRWFGLLQLVLLNIIVSWDWLTYAPVANTAASFFDTSTSVVNWLSTAFLFAFVVASPVVYYVLRSGPKLSIQISSALLLLGNWIRYGGTRTSSPSFPAVMVGQILLGLAQPFVLAAPTRYSDLWFSPRGRVAATALASLANPFGGALGQLIDPFIATKPSDIPNLTLYVAIISSVATIPSFFIPAQPPTPVAPSSLHERPTVARQVSYLLSNPTAWLICIAFSTYVGFFNSFSSLLTQILTPYDFSEEDSGLAGAVLILVGLVVAAISSPLVDKYKPYLLMIKILVPLLALSYLAFVWAPDSRSIAAPYVICAVTGATSFSLVPIALEWAVEVTWPVGPELTSVIFWAGGQMLGGVFIIISDALMAGADAEPPFNMHKALIFQAVVALAVVPLVMALGYVGSVKTRRLEVDNGESVVEG